jgi:hypothetical protein
LLRIRGLPHQRYRCSRANASVHVISTDAVSSCRGADVSKGLFAATSCGIGDVRMASSDCLVLPPLFVTFVLCGCCCFLSLFAAV